MSEKAISKPLICLGNKKISDDGPSKIFLFANVPQEKRELLGILLFHDFDPNF